jgi:hypothetical protein
MYNEQLGTWALEVTRMTFMGLDEAVPVIVFPPEAPLPS